MCSLKYSVEKEMHLLQVSCDDLNLLATAIDWYIIFSSISIYRDRSLLLLLDMNFILKVPYKTSAHDFFFSKNNCSKYFSVLDIEKERKKTRERTEIKKSGGDIFFLYCIQTKSFLKNITLIWCTLGKKLIDGLIKTWIHFILSITSWKRIWYISKPLDNFI